MVRPLWHLPELPDGQSAPGRRHLSPVSATVASLKGGVSGGLSLWLQFANSPLDALKFYTLHLIRAQASKAQGPIDFLRIIIIFFFFFFFFFYKAQGPIDFLRIIIFFFIQPSGYFWGP